MSHACIQRMVVVGVVIGALLSFASCRELEPPLPTATPSPPVKEWYRLDLPPET